MTDILVTPQGKHIFELGDTFSSYQELEDQLEVHSRESFVTYWRRDTRTLKGAHRKTTRPISEELVYYSLRLACVFGGQKFSTRGQGKRSCQSLRTDCPAHITLRASKCGQKLVVISVCNTHNHELTDKLNKSLPQNRKLTPEMKEEVLLLLKTTVARNLIIEYIKLKTGKELTKKDLFNLAATSRRKDEGEKSQAVSEEIVNKMMTYLGKHSTSAVTFAGKLSRGRKKTARKRKIVEKHQEDSVNSLEDLQTFNSIVLESDIGIEEEEKLVPDLIELDNSSILEIVDSQSVEFVEYHQTDSPIVEYSPEGDKNEETKVIKRKRWKSSCYCRCRSSSLKLLELKMKFLRLKCKKMHLEVEELKRKKKKLSRRITSFKI